MHNAIYAGPEELKGYIEHLIAKLLEVIAGGTPDSQETALGALASAANAAGTSFQPFVGAVFPVLRQFMEVRTTQHPKVFVLVPSCAAELLVL